MKTLGLYVHIPFCLSKCAYCDFVSYAGREADMRLYVDSLLAEAAMYREAFACHAVDSVYLGGGTPSCLPEGLAARLLDGLRRCFHIDESAECTLEANPGTLTRDKLACYRACGLNRISIGMQSHDDALLRLLGRAHSHADFLHAYGLVRGAGFENVSCDVMFGVPGQSMGCFEQTLRALVDLGPEHVSAYALKIEPGTPFYETYGDNAGDEEIDRAQCHAAVRTLTENGYAQYETSNFAKAGFACRHNLKYWTQRETLGLGVSAHTHVLTEGGPVRRENAATLDGYIAAVRAGRPPAVRETPVGRAEQMREHIMLRLRLNEGIAYARFSQSFNVDFASYFKEEIARLQKAGLVHADGKGVRPLRRGFDLQNAMILEFIKKL